MNIANKTKHWVFRYYLWFAVSLVGFSLFAVFKFGINWDDKLKLMVLGGLITFVFFIQKQKLEETRLFKELFQDFNSRYKLLNEALNRIRNESDSIGTSPQGRDILYDYFNLCAEEHLFYSQGYIPEEVWRSWWAGMSTFFECPRIWEEWNADPSSNAYYGFVPPVAVRVCESCGGKIADHRHAA